MLCTLNGKPTLQVICIRNVPERSWGKNELYHPPPLLLNSGPKLLRVGNLTPHPWLLVENVSQLSDMTVLYIR